MRETGARCPQTFRYYSVKLGYLCGGGHHFVSHEEVEGLLRGHRPWGPLIEEVNVLDAIAELVYGHPVRVVTPPPEPRNEWFNLDWRTVRRMGAHPLPKNSEGKWFDPGPPAGYYHEKPE